MKYRLIFISKYLWKQILIKLKQINSGQNVRAVKVSTLTTKINLENKNSVQ